MGTGCTHLHRVKALVQFEKGKKLGQRADEKAAGG